MQAAAVIYIVLAIVIVVALFVRGRVREGIPVFKLTAQDRADLRRARRELGIRRVSARLVGGLAGFCFIAAILALFHRDRSGGVNWTTAVVLTVLSQILLLCAVLLLKSAR